MIAQTIDLALGLVFALFAFGYWLRRQNTRPAEQPVRIETDNYRRRKR